MHLDGGTLDVHYVERLPCNAGTKPQQPGLESSPDPMLHVNPLSLPCPSCFPPLWLIKQKCGGEKKHLEALYHRSFSMGEMHIPITITLEGTEAMRKTCLISFFIFHFLHSSSALLYSAPITSSLPSFYSSLPSFLPFPPFPPLLLVLFFLRQGKKQHESDFRTPHR